MSKGDVLIWQPSGATDIYFSVVVEDLCPKCGDRRVLDYLAYPLVVNGPFDMWLATPSDRVALYVFIVRGTLLASGASAKSIRTNTRQAHTTETWAEYLPPRTL